MQPVTSLDALFAALDAVKRQAAVLQTNLFIDRAQYQHWIERGALAMTAADDMLLLARRDRDFRHLYYWGDARALAGALAEYTESARAVTVADLIHREHDEAATAVLLQAGFTPYARLHRMALTGVPDSETGDSDIIRPARPADASAVLTALETIFDRFAENLPEADEIRRAAEEGRLLTIPRGGEIGGGLLFDLNGASAHMRYCWVEQRFHGQGLGTALVRRYHANCPQVRRFLLWVQPGNAAATALYRRFGYSFDGLQDTILRWGKEPV